MSADSRGGDTIIACLSSAQSLRVQGSMAMIPVRGKKCRVLRNTNDVIDDTPQPKRKSIIQTLLSVSLASLGHIASSL